MCFTLVRRCAPGTLLLNLLSGTSSRRQQHSPTSRSQHTALHEPTLPATKVAILKPVREFNMLKRRDCTPLLPFKEHSAAPEDGHRRSVPGETEILLLWMRRIVCNNVSRSQHQLPRTTPPPTTIDVLDAGRPVFRSTKRPYPDVVLLSNPPEKAANMSAMHKTAVGSKLALT